MLTGSSSTETFMLRCHISYSIPQKTRLTLKIWPFHLPLCATKLKPSFQITTKIWIVRLFIRVINLTIFTCTVRFRSLTNTLLNLVSLRYRPTASHCWIPVSDRTASIPWPKRDISVITDVSQSVSSSATHLTWETHLEASRLCCTVFRH